jgi:hypothetical protein
MYTATMGKRVQVAVAVLLLVVLGIGVWKILHPQEPEPTVDGRPLTGWLDDLDGSTEAQRAAQQAVAKAGTNAVPKLQRMLRQSDSPLKCRMLEFAQTQPLITVHFIPARSRNREAWLAFNTLGTCAADAVPELIEICDRNISNPSQVCAVRSLAGIGPVAKMAIPMLLRQAATNANVTVRVDSMDALVRLHTDPELAVPALMKGLSDPTGSGRLVACRSLGRLGGEARQAVPVLVRLLADPFPGVEESAAEALKQIDREAAARAGVVSP